MTPTSQADQMQEIREAASLRKWRIELPNMIDDADLTVYEFRLLVHYIRRGNCWENVRTTAETCHMSVGMVPKAREGLIEKGWIVHKGFSDQGTLILEPANRWEENFKKYSNWCSCGEQECSCGEQECSCGETKNKPIKNKPIKNNDNESLTLEERTGLLCRLHEQNIGVLTPLLGDSLKDAATIYTIDSWYEPAFKIAVKNNARNWNYVEAVLKGWKDHGFGWKPEHKNGRRNGNGRIEHAGPSIPLVKAPANEPPVVSREAVQAAKEKYNKRLAQK